MNHTKKRRVGKFLIALCLSLSIAFSGTMIVNPQPVHAAVSSTSVAKKVIATGKKYLGVRYVFGAKSGRTNAFDCSSFVQHIFKQQGKKLPRSSRQQAKSGKYVAKKNLRAGDLIFSDTNRDGIINHVSVYMGNNKILHTYKKGIGVTISNFKGSAWDKTYVTARRVI